MIKQRTIAAAAAAALIASGGAVCSAYGSASGHTSDLRQPLSSRSQSKASPAAKATGAAAGRDAVRGAIPRGVASEDEARHVTIRFHANEVRRNTIVDVGKPGTSPGDQIIENETLIRHGRVIGRDAVQCTLINPTHTRNFLVQCAVTWRLPGGQVTAQGAFSFDSIKVAITGGTGAFRGASGVATILGTDNPLNDIDVLRLVLPPR